MRETHVLLCGSMIVPFDVIVPRAPGRACLGMVISRLEQLERDSVRVVEIADPPTSIRPRRDEHGRHNERSACARQACVFTIDIRYDEGHVGCAHVLCPKRPKLAAGFDVLNQFEQNPILGWIAWQTELGDLEDRVPEADEATRVLVVLALAADKLETENIPVPSDRSLDIRDGE